MAQSVEGLLQKANGFYTDTGSYEIAMTYTMYRGLTGNRATESYKGTVQKQDRYSKTTMVGSDVINYGKEVLLVDHRDKLISYQKNSGRHHSYSPVHLDGFLLNFKKTQLIDKGNYWICEMSNTQKVTQIPYGKVHFYVDKDTFTITRQVLFFNNKVPFKGKDGEREMDFGRLQVDLEHRLDVKIVKVPLGDFIVEDQNGKIALQKAYKSYTYIAQ